MYLNGGVGGILLYRKNLDEFIAFSIKIRMQGTNSSEPPRLKDLRAIALAT